MPRNVRNFWLDGYIDGRTTMLRGGPQRKDGGFELRIHMRDDGMVHRDVCNVWGTAADDGTLRLHVAIGSEARNGADVLTYTTHRDKPVHEAGMGPVVNGERFAPGYTREAAAYEQRTREEIPADSYAVHRGITQ